MKNQILSLKYFIVFCLIIESYIYMCMTVLVFYVPLKHCVTLMQNFI